MNRTLDRSYRAIALALALTAGSAAAALAQSETGGTPGDWLNTYASARSMGMGNAYVAGPDDALGMLWNPAGVSVMDQNQLRFETARLFESTSINALGFAMPGSRWPSFGITMLSLTSGDFQRTNSLNDPLGTFSEGETAWMLTLSKALNPKIALGANVKFVQQTVEDFSGSGVGFDLGGIYTLTPNVRFGFSAANIGGPSITLRSAAEDYPMMMRGGVTVALMNGRALVAAQVDQSQGLGTRFHAGGEYHLFSGIALRAGYDDSDLGGGFSYRFMPNYELDYAVADHPLGMTHRIGVSYRFGGFFAQSHAEPSVFSPTGEHAVTRISLNAKTKTKTESWSLSIMDKSDRVVRTFGGQGQPSPHIEWDGKDETGLPLADGIYRYRLEVKDTAGRIVQSPMRTIEISTGGPQGTVPVIPVQ
jgi:hypothetical protein